MLSLLFRDDDLAVISKPSGLLVHRSELDPHDTQNALKLLKYQLGCHVYPTHRLDKATSGVLIFALNPEAAKAVNLAFDNRQVNKTYVGVVRGYIDACGTIDYALGKKVDKMEEKRNAEPVMQDAVTTFERMATTELPFSVGRYPTARYSLARLKPITGRRHQLRRHMKHIFHPLVGDTTYGDGRHNTFFRDHFNCHRLLLHCQTMIFPHPSEGRSVSITAPLDDEFQRVLDAMGWQKMARQMNEDSEESESILRSN